MARLARFLPSLGWLTWAVFLWRIGVSALDGSGGLQWDSGRLAADNAALRACFSAGKFRCEGGGHFPLYQHLIAFVLGYTGAQAFTVVRGLAIVSFLAFLKTLVLGWGTLPGRMRHVWLLLVGTSPFLYYAQSSFGEMLAATAVVTAVAGSLTGVAAPWLFATAAFAGITKEIAPPFVLMLSAAALYAIESDRRVLKRKMIALALGCLLAIVANATFNLVRFGVPWNAYLLGPSIPQVPLHERPGFFLGLWFSPNGGLFFFWPALVALLAYLVVRRPRDSRVLPLCGALVVLLAMTAGLSGWWAPFGWICWGPRLLLPWLPGILLILLKVYPREFEPVLSLRGWRTYALAALVVTAGFFQFSSLFGYSVIYSIFAAAPGCPTIPMKPEQDPIYYFNCMRTYVWEPRISLSELAASCFKSETLGFSIAYVCAMFSSTVQARTGKV